MKSLRQTTPPVSELSLDGLGINFEDDEWFLRRNVIDGIVAVSYTHLTLPTKA